MKSKLSIIFLGFFVLTCVGLCIYNICTNSQFFIAPFTTILSVLIAVVVSFYFVQRKTDYRRKNEKIDKLLYKIQDIILDRDFLVIKESDLIIQRSVANKIEYLVSNSSGNVHDDIEKIKDQFNAFRDFYGNHYKDTEYMEKSQKELRNYIGLIDDICDEIHIKLS